MGPEVYTQTWEHMTGARSSLRGLRGHHGSFPSQTLTLGSFREP